MVEAANGGDIRARDTIVERLQPLVISSIRKYYFQDDEFYDLIQDGSIKILECIENYDPSRGVYFLGYVKAMLRYLYLDMHKVKRPSISLNEKDGGSNIEKIDLLESQEEATVDFIIYSEEIDELYRALENLTNRQREIVYLFYHEKMPIGDIAAKLEVSYRTVVNTKTVALKKLKTLLL